MTFSFQSISIDLTPPEEYREKGLRDFSIEVSPFEAIRLAIWMLWRAMVSIAGMRVE